ncbi:MAG: class D sortase [Bacilli bacterium]|jgi:sortase A|nr:class D sortase [Bacilli bacterium]
MSERKKKNNVIKRILQLLIIVCLVLSAFFLYRYFDDINSQYRNSEISLKKVTTILEKKTDIRKKDNKPLVGDPIGKITIEGLTGEMPIIEGADIKLAMAYGVGHIDFTPLPGTNTGQPAFSAHRETFFKALKDAKVGDVVVVTMPYGTYKYKISKSMIVNPDEGAKVYNHSDMKSKERIALITCYPFSAWSSPDKRIVFYADLIE